MMKAISSPKEDAAKREVLVVQEATTEIKSIIVSDVSLGVDSDETTKKLNKTIAKYSGLIKDAKLQEEVRKSLVESARKWYYEYKSTIDIFRHNLKKEIEPIISKYNSFGLTSKDKTYTADIRSLLKTNTLSEDRIVIDKIRPYLDKSSKGLAIIEDYEKKVKSHLKMLSANPPKSSRIASDGKPYAVSLRNRAEMKVRFEANMEDLARLSSEGVKLVWTTSHPDCSPRCKQYQGKLWSLDGSRGNVNGINYEPIEVALKGPRGDGNGIISGYNCRHRLIEYQDKSKPPTEYTPEEIKREYQIDQRQRMYENNIRQLKTQERLARASGDLNQAKLLRTTWRRMNASYEAYSIKNGRAFYTWRTRISNEEKNIAVENKIIEIDINYEKIYNDNKESFTVTNFANQKLLNKHIEKHIDDFPEIESQEYETKAKEFLEKKVDGKRILGFTNKNGFVFRYDKVNNIFATAKPDGTIETFFKPKEKIFYWGDQIDKYGRPKS